MRKLGNTMRARSWVRAAVAAAAALCFVLTSQIGHAEDKKRPVPDYGRRGSPSDDTLKAALWVPRALVYPVYLATEYLVRWPIGKLLSAAEGSGVPAMLYDVLAFGPDHKAGVFPTLFVDSGSQVSIGAYLFWDDAFVKGHQLRARASFSGNDWISTGISERFRYGPDAIDRIGWEVAFLRRPDYLYFGTGPETLQSDALRYGRQTLTLSGNIERRLWRLSSVRAGVTGRLVDFQRGLASEDHSTLDDAIAAGAVEAPPGYPQGYSEVLSELSGVLDTRQPTRPASGIRIAAGVRHSIDAQQMGSWLRYGATVGGYWDVDGHQRVLSLAAGARFVDPIAKATIPFTELVALGGNGEAMVGFYTGRLWGRSATAVSLSYRWPVWAWVDGVLRFEVGNVFDEHLSDFRPGLLRYSASIAVESRLKGESEFQAALGFGSNTFESGASVDSIRATVGTSYDF